MKTNHPCFILILTLFVFSCTQEVAEPLKNNPYEFLQAKQLENYQIPEADVKALQKLGFTGSSGVVLEKIDFVNKKPHISYLMEGDIEIRQDHLHAMAKGQVLNKQFRTSELVDAPNNIHIIAVNFDSRITRAAMRRAVENYNELQLELTFTLEFRAAELEELDFLYTESEIVIWQFPGIAIGFSGFPMNGEAHPLITFGNEIADYGVSGTTCLLTHEIGHAIGLRHTDYFDRSLSCGGDPIDEGQTEYGAIHIPGTPAFTNIDLSSVMEACFSNTCNGEFTKYDALALRTLY